MQFGTSPWKYLSKSDNADAKLEGVPDALAVYCCGQEGKWYPGMQ